jgi:hypothetical protein
MNTLRHRVLSLALLGGAVAGALATLPATGHAATAGTSSAQVRTNGGQLQLDYTGSADANTVLITTEAGGAIRVSDSVTIVPGPGCSQADGDPTTVRCSAGIARILARLGDGDDRFRTLVPFQGYVEGDNGNDTFTVGAAEGSVASRIMYAGHLGEDTTTYEGASAGVTVTLDFAYNDGRPASGTRPADQDNIQTENIVGTSFGDRLTGDRLDNEITPGRGRDTVSGGNGNDLIDVRDGEAENSVQCGDGGADRAVADRAALDPVNADCEQISR